MRKTPSISQTFYNNPSNQLIASLKQQMETDPKHFMGSILEPFQANFTTKPFSPSSSMQSVVPAEGHQTRASQLHFVYKHRVRKTHLSCVASVHTHIQALL